MKRQFLVTLGFALLSTMALVGCTKGSKGSSGGNTGAGACAATQVYINYGGYVGCYENAPCVSYGANYGYIPGLNQCIAGTQGGTVPPSGARHMWSSYLMITSPSTYRRYLKDYGVCGGGVVNESNGLNCEQWDDTAAISMEVSGSGTLPASSVVTFTAYQDYNWYYPVALPRSGTLALANSSTAFEMRSTGPAYNKIFSMIGDKGSLLNGSTLVPQTRVIFTYDGEQMGYADLILRY